MPVKNQGRVGERIVRLRDMQAAASIALLLMSVSTQPGMAQQTTPQHKRRRALRHLLLRRVWPAIRLGRPACRRLRRRTPTEPLFLRDTPVDYTQPKSHFWNPIAPYTATDVPQATTQNTPRLDSLLRDGKIYLSLSDAVTLALENNYDIAIARINLDIADTDILRTKAGGTIRGVSTGLVTNTIGGTTRRSQRRRPGWNIEWSGRRCVGRDGHRAEHQRRRTHA